MALLVFTPIELRIPSFLPIHPKIRDINPIGQTHPQKTRGKIIPTRIKKAPIPTPIKKKFGGIPRLIARSGV